MDLSLYKDESQIEKKKAGKRKAKHLDAGEKASPAAKKQKVSTTKARETPIARASRSNVGGTKSTDSESAKSAKVRMKKKNSNQTKIQ